MSNDVLDSEPPESMEREPCPFWPIVISCCWDQLEPGPLTVTLPLDPLKTRTVAILVVNVLPPVTFTSPVPEDPMDKLFSLVQLDPSPSTVTRPSEKA